MVETLKILSEIQSDYRERERDMLFRYPWFNMAYNYFLAFIVLLLIISLAWWGSCSYWAYKTEKEQEKEDRAYQAELVRSKEAEAEAERQKQKELEDMLDRWAEAGAKMLWGIRLFIDKYNYTQADLETYLRCPWNRYLSDGKLTDIEKIIFRDEQFTGAYRTNAAPDRYKAFARKMFEKFEAEEEPACDIKYVCAELTPKGIYLVPDPDSDGYVQRWHA